jgi:hypothetical protein
MKLKFFIIILVLGFSTQFYGQIKHKMEFPNIYFKLNSTDYADMPYKVDSCFKMMVKHINIDSVHNNIYLFFRRDSSETDQLTEKRIVKLKQDLNKFKITSKIYFKNSGTSQKIVKENRKIKRRILTLRSVVEVNLVTREPFDY